MEALKEVRKNRFRRSAVATRDEDSLRFYHAGLGPRDRTALAFVMALISLFAAAGLNLNLAEAAVSAISVYLITWFTTLWLGFGIRKSVLSHYGRFLFPGESLVVVQESEDHAAEVLSLLRHISHVSVFAIRPRPLFTSATREIGSCTNPSQRRLCPITRQPWLVCIH